MIRSLRPRGLLFKRVLLLFGSMYFTMIALTNAINLLNEVGALGWTFLDSHYFGSMRDATAKYDVSAGP
jgi:hypothetical protein